MDKWSDNCKFLFIVLVFLPIVLAVWGREHNKEVDRNAPLK